MIENPKKYTEAKSIHISLSEEASKSLDNLSKVSGYSKSKIISMLIEQTREVKANEDRDM